MKTRRPERAETVLWEVLRRLGLADRVREGKAVLVWPGAVGAAGATRSRAVGCKGGRLLVEVENSSWMQELACMKSEIRGALNRELGEELVKDVVFRLAIPEASEAPPAGTENAGSPPDTRG